MDLRCNVGAVCDGGMAYADQVRLKI